MGLVTILKKIPMHLIRAGRERMIARIQTLLGVMSTPML